MTKSEHFSNPGRRLVPCGTRYFADLGEVGDMPDAPRAPHNATPEVVAGCSTLRLLLQDVTKTDALFRRDSISIPPYR